MYFLKIEANIRLILQIMMTTLSLVPFLLNMKKNKEKFNKYIGKHASISTVSSVIICSVGVLMSIYLIMMTPSSTIMLLRIIFFLSVAVTEEYIFRGYFYRKFQDLFSSRKSGLVYAILIQVFLFMLMHIFTNININNGSIEWFAFVTQFIAGLIFSLARWKTKNILVPAGLHWLLDMTNLF